MRSLYGVIARLGIYGSCLYAFMAQHLLHLFNGHSALQRQRSGGSSESVRMYVVYPAPLSEFSKHYLNAAWRESRQDTIA